MSGKLGVEIPAVVDLIAADAAKIGENARKLREKMEAATPRAPQWGIAGVDAEDVVAAIEALREWWEASQTLDFERRVTAADRLRVVAARVSRAP